MPNFNGKWYDPHNPAELKLYRHLYYTNYYREHRETMRASQTRYLERNKERAKERAREYHREYRAKNADKIKEYQRTQLVKERQRVIQHKRYWGDFEHREKVKQRNKEHYQANKCEYKAKRDAKKNMSNQSQGVVVSFD